MMSFIARRVLTAIPTLLVIVTIAFFLIRAAPGGPFDLERPLDPAVLANLKRVYGLDGSVASQYFAYLAALARGDLGPSFVLRDFSVAEILGKGLPVSLRLGALALGLALVVGGTLGVIAAFRQNSAVDVAVIGFATLGLTIPPFVAAPLFQIAFGLTLQWLPVGGWNDGAWRNTLLPVLTLALPQIAVIARMIRAAMIEALRSNPIRTLRSQGLSTPTIARHALRAAALPVVSYLGPAAAQMLTGSLVVETIFGLPGVGRYFIEGALGRDYTLVMGTVVLIAVFVLVLNLVVDVLYALLDPRVRHD